MVLLPLLASYAKGVGADMCRVFCVLLHFSRWEIDYKKIKYKEKIAKGNFGEVWLGSWLGSPVAIKTVIGSMAQDSEFIERFVLEIKLMSNLHHPNIVMHVFFFEGLSWAPGFGGG